MFRPASRNRLLQPDSTSIKSERSNDGAGGLEGCAQDDSWFGESQATQPCVKKLVSESFCVYHVFVLVRYVVISVCIVLLLLWQNYDTHVYIYISFVFW